MTVDDVQDDALAAAGEPGAAHLTSTPTAVVVRLTGPVPLADLPGLCARMRALLAEGACTTVLCDVEAAADLAVVDTLVRLQLAVLRARSRLRLRRVSPEVAGLLALTGLSAVVCDLQPGRQSEAGEQRGVEEVVEVDDPPG